MFTERLTKFTERLTNAAKKVLAEWKTNSIASVRKVGKSTDPLTSAMLMVTIATIIVSPSIVLILGLYILIISLVNANNALREEENEVEKVDGSDAE